LQGLGIFLALLFRGGKLQICGLPLPLLFMNARWKFASSRKSLSLGFNKISSFHELRRRDENFGSSQPVSPLRRPPTREPRNWHFSELYFCRQSEV
jgi:hypothetical protein